MYYTKNAKDTHPELMENALGCPTKQTHTEQKEVFNDIIRGALGPDEKKSDHFFMEIQESLNNKIEEHNSIYEESDVPIVLTNDVVQEILSLSGVPEEVTTKIEKSYTENFGDTPPVAEILIDNKALAAKAQKKKEEMLESKLERVSQASSSNSENEKTSLELENEDAIEVDSSNISSEDIDDSISKDNLNTNTDLSKNLDENIDNSTNTSEDYDIILKVKPEKVPQIKSQIIDGKKYLVIPIDENEQTTVNGIDSLV